MENSRFEKMRLKKQEEKLKELKRTKIFEYDNTSEEATMKVKLEYGSMNFETFRKGCTQSRGAKSNYNLNKKEVEELIDFLKQQLENWE